MTPSATVDITIESGNSWSYPLVYEEGNPPVAVDLLTAPAWSGEATFWDASGVKFRAGAGPYFPDLVVDPALGAFVIAAGGLLTVSMTPTGTRLLTSSGRWQFRVVNGQGAVKRILRGKMIVQRGPEDGQLTGGEGY